MNWLTPTIRRRIYLALSALLPLAAVYGLIDQEQTALWLTLAAAVLGTGGSIMAAANTSKPSPADVVEDVVDEVRQRAGDLLGSATSSWLGAASSATAAWHEGRR